MKNTLTAFGLGLFLLGSSFVPVLAQAETSTSSDVSKLESLLQQIKELQDEIAALINKQSDLQKELKETVALARELRSGMSSDDVKALQEILAADPEIYPEGLITGYYGPLTEKAVLKFQKKYGLEQVGFVGPKTLKKLNDLLDDDDFTCKAWGKLIAPGQQKKIGGHLIDVSGCTNVPGGIAKKLQGWWWKNGTSTATSSDTTAPIFKNIEIDDVSDDGAKIAWETNEKASGVVWYDDDSNVDLDPDMKESASTFSTSHEISLEGLENDTDYYFVIVAKDKAGNTATSSVKHFTTGATPTDTSAPDFEDIDVNDISTSSAEVAWETDEDARGIVWYDDDSSVDLNPDMKESVTSFDDNHSVLLESLATSTDYYFIIVSEDEAGNTATSSVTHFKTLAD